MINNTDQKDMSFRKKIQILFELEKKYDLDEKIMLDVEKLISKDVPMDIQLQKFSKSFRWNEKIHLDFFYHYKEMKKISLFKNLNREVIADVGRLAQKIFYEPGKTTF
jgi:hypothetical protein